LVLRQIACGLSHVHILFWGSEFDIFTEMNTGGNLKVLRRSSKEMGKPDKYDA
jgi:hypothetical protein